MRKLIYLKDVYELAPPNEVNLVKITLSLENKKWIRNVEINGHEITYKNYDWPMEIPSDGTFALCTVFAAFHYFDKQDYILERRKSFEKIDNAIKIFMDIYKKHVELNLQLDLNTAGDLLSKEISEDELVYNIITFIPPAFVRILLSNHKLNFTENYMLILSDSTIKKDKKLIENKVFARAISIGKNFLENAEYSKTFEYISCLSAEYNAINAALNNGSKMEDLIFSPIAIPDINVDSEMLQKTIKKYFEELNDKN